MKQSNKYLIFSFLIFLKLIFELHNCFGLANSSQNLNFGSQKPNSQIVQAANRPDSYARICANRNNLIQLQLAAELDLLAQLRPGNINLVLLNNSHDSNSSFNINQAVNTNLPAPRIYTENYSPFVSGDLSETFYSTYAYLNSHYRIAQETKYPYLAKQRHAREQQAGLALQAREQANRQQLALDLVQDYNYKLERKNRLTNLKVPYEIKLPEQFFNTKFSNSEQQLLHQQQVEIVYELADHELFPRNIMGLQDFSNTVLETVSIAHQANCKNKINIAESFTNLAQDFMALGRGLARGGYNFASNITNTGSNLILHPINSSKIVANKIAHLTKNVAMGLLKVLVILADVTDEYNPEGPRSYILAAQDYGHERYQQFCNYIETVPRNQKFEQAGTMISEQLLNLTAGFLTGKTVALLSDSVIAAQLHKAIKIKNKTDKTKTKQISWLNKFGVSGKDVAQALGLVITEEYELATLDGLVVSFKNNSTNNQSLFNHAEEYLKHNKFGKKAKQAPKIVKTFDEIKPARVIGHQKSLPELRLEAKELAAKMGFKETKDFVFDSCTEKVYKKGNLYISLDRNGHKGGFWKIFDKRHRLSTCDRNLEEIIGD